MLPFAINIVTIKVIMPYAIDDPEREKILFIDADIYKTLKTDDIVILESCAYCRLDNKEKNIFIFSHE